MSLWLTQYGNGAPLAVWRPLARMALLVMLPLGVEALAPLDARTANSSPLIVVGAPGSGLSSSTPSYSLRRGSRAVLVAPALRLRYSQRYARHRNRQNRGLKTPFLSPVNYVDRAHERGLTVINSGRQSGFG